MIYKNTQGTECTDKLRGKAYKTEQIWTHITKNYKDEDMKNMSQAIP